MICRSCKAEHSPLMDCKRWARILEARRVIPEKLVAEVLRPRLVSNNEEMLDKPDPVLDKPAGFDKKAYQREWMKRMRAERKVKMPSDKALRAALGPCGK